MLVTIQNARPVGGTITAPPSKSMAHRAVLCAALAEGRSHITNLEFSDAIRVYRVFLTLITGFWGLHGFGIGLLLILLSAATTPTFGGLSYYWPLFPFNAAALKSLLLRKPTYKAQPSKVWDRGHLHRRRD